MKTEVLQSIVLISIVIYDHIIVSVSMYGSKKFMKGLFIGHMLGMKKHHHIPHHMILPPVYPPPIITPPMPVPFPVSAGVGASVAVATPMTLPFGAGMTATSTLAANGFGVNPFGLNLLPQINPFGLQTL